MKIGLNLLYLLPGIVGGTETYAAGLIYGLAQIDSENEYIVFVNREAATWPLPSAPNFTRVVCPVWATSRARRYFFEQAHLPRLLKQHNVDIVHSLGYVSPLFRPRPTIVTIHDLNYRAFGRQMPVMRRFMLEFFVKQSALRVRRVITVSEFSRYEIASAFKLPLHLIAVTYEAARIRQGADNEDEASHIQERLRIRPPYVVAFSSQSPHKNISCLLQAFERARERYTLSHQLVLIGHRPVREQSSGGGPGIAQVAVCFTGYLGDREMQTVLSGAQLMVFPSFYEGFGLPVLEAMAAGVPVVCSNRASLPEVAGDAAIFFDPYSVDDMAQKIAQVALDPALQEELRLEGFQNVKRFSWDKTARETLAVYSTVYHSSRAF